MFKLKKNVADFVVVDGSFARKRYRAGEVYAQVPPEYINKFEPARSGQAHPAITAPPGTATGEKAWRGRKDKKGGKK